MPPFWFWQTVNHSLPGRGSSTLYDDQVDETFTDPDSGLHFERTEISSGRISNGAGLSSLQVDSTLSSDISVTPPPNQEAGGGSDIMIHADFTYDYIDEATNQAVDYEVVQSGSVTFNYSGTISSEVYEFMVQSNEVYATRSGDNLVGTYVLNNVYDDFTYQDFFTPGTHIATITFSVSGFASGEHIHYNADLANAVHTPFIAHSSPSFSIAYTLDVTPSP